MGPWVNLLAVQATQLAFNSWNPCLSGGEDQLPKVVL